MSFEGTTTKVHLLEGSRQLMVTKLVTIRRVDEPAHSVHRSSSAIARDPQHHHHQSQHHQSQQQSNTTSTDSNQQRNNTSTSTSTVVRRHRSSLTGNYHGALSPLRTTDDASSLRKTTFALAILFRLPAKVPIMKHMLLSHFVWIDFRLNKLLEDLKMHALRDIPGPHSTNAGDTSSSRRKRVCFISHIYICYDML